MAHHQGDSDGAARLFVSRIPPHVTKEDVVTYFQMFGPTTDVYLPVAPGMTGHKGIAFVSYADAITAQLAINSGPHIVAGSEVVVDFAAPRGGGPPAARAPMAPQVQYAGHAGGGNNFPGGVDPAAQEGRLFVTKVSPALNRDNLREHFAQFGELTDVYLPQAPGAAVHKGICFVSFANPASLALALQGAPHEIMGHQVVVDIAAPRGQAPPRPGASQAFAGGGFALAANPYGVLPPSQQVAAFNTVQLGGGIAFAQPGVYVQQPSVQMIAPVATAPAPAAGGAMGQPVPGRLFITRVTPDMTKEDLQLYFQQFGVLSDVFVPSGGKGIAFVTYTDANVAAQVLMSQQHQVKPGQAVLVDQARDRPPLGGKGGKGCFGGAAPTAPMAYGGAADPSFGAVLTEGHAFRAAPY
mmetsp:Transcript_59503/g.153213  ORF Transcript_59503/g.153213 Transcript_59503/m.153213 type:complete len:411 (+) Transcript_59503:148-1380(+)